MAARHDRLHGRAAHVRRLAVSARTVPIDPEKGVGRMKKLLSLITVSGLVIAMAGCKLDMRSEAYVSDLRAVASGATGITTLTTLTIEIPSHEECDKYAAAVSTVMQGLMRDFSPRRCGQDGLNSYLLAEAQLPLVHSPEAWRQANSLFGVMLAPAAQDIAMTLVMDLQKYGTLNQRMKDEFSQAIDLPASRLTMVLNNDEREPSEFLAQAVFIRDEPVIEARAFALQRRQKVDIRLSNVSAAYLEKHGSAPVLALKNVQASEPK